jgi:hypothetical protein
MSTPTEIRAALGTHLKLIPKLVVSANLPAIQTLGDGGSAVVGGPTADYTGAMGRGLVTWNYPIYVLAPTANYDAATALLDELTAPYGDRSVVELLWNYGREAVGGLGILDNNGRPNVDAHISELTAYGVEFANAGIDHIGAVLNCVVHTPGRPA